jgi:hypothetical protein
VTAQKAARQPRRSPTSAPNGTPNTSRIRVGRSPLHRGDLPVLLSAHRGAPRPATGSARPSRHRRRERCVRHAAKIDTMEESGQPSCRNCRLARFTVVGIAVDHVLTCGHPVNPLPGFFTCPGAHQGNDRQAVSPASRGRGNGVRGRRRLWRRRLRML